MSMPRVKRNQEPKKWRTCEIMLIRRIFNQSLLDVTVIFLFVIRFERSYDIWSDTNGPLINPPVNKPP